MQYRFICFYAVYFTQLISISIGTPVYTIKCYGSRDNCTITRLEPAPSRVRDKPETNFSTSRYPFTTTPTPSPYSQFSRNFKIAALAVAGIALGLGILRLCLLLCNKSSRPTHNRHTAVVQPQIAMIGQTRVKPDLPPAYAEAVAYVEQDESKLPSYEELRAEPSAPRS